MSPSTTIIAAATVGPTVIDKLETSIDALTYTSLDKLRLFKAAGPFLSQNQPWLGMAMLVCSVAEIDSVPVPPPTNEQQVESLVARLGDSGSLRSQRRSMGTRKSTNQMRWPPRETEQAPRSD